MMRNWGLPRTPWVSLEADAAVPSILQMLTALASTWLQPNQRLWSRITLGSAPEFLTCVNHEKINIYCLKSLCVEVFLIEQWGFNIASETELIIVSTSCTSLPWFFTPESQKHPFPLVPWAASRSCQFKIHNMDAPVTLLLLSIIL